MNETLKPPSQKEISNHKTFSVIRGCHLGVIDLSVGWPARSKVLRTEKKEKVVVLPFKETNGCLSLCSFQIFLKPP